MNQTTFSVLRVDFSKVPTQNKPYLRGSLTRFASANFGHVFCSEDCGFFFTDLEGQRVATLQRICEVSGAVSSLRLVSSSFFDKLFNGNWQVGEVVK